VTILLIISVWQRTLPAEDGFPESLKRLADLVSMKMQDVNEPRVRLGRFVAPDDPQIHYEPKILEVLNSILKDKISPSANLTLSGDYIVKFSDDKPVEIEFQFALKSRNGQHKYVFVDRVSDPLDVARIIGLTAFFNQGLGHKRMQATVVASLERQKPMANGQTPNLFWNVAGSKSIVTADEESPYAVEIYRKDVNSKISPLEIKSRDGYAYVHLDVDDVFLVRLYNSSETRVLAKLFIDGTDTINVYNKDKVLYAGYVIDAAKESAPSFSDVRGFLKTTKTSESNVFEFTVKPRGAKGEDRRQVDSPGARIGVIAVEFYSPAAGTRGPVGGKQVVQGKPVDVNVKVTDFLPQDRPTTIVAIRYDVP
jgi:hypothetical protein